MENFFYHIRLFEYYLYVYNTIFCEKKQMRKKNKEDFICEESKIHSCKYDYSKRNITFEDKNELIQEIKLKIYI